ncbi:CpaF family protein [Georgenia sp. SUBG003]|uniref:CpaF family protein n=1 Tax=Georgenia sp. SUBG003 TaxID=1497974 RepID=UPI003AB1D220
MARPHLRSSPTPAAPVPTPSAPLGPNVRPSTDQGGLHAATTAQADPTRPQNDAVAKLKDRAANALFERIGSRLTDSSLSEEQLHKLVRTELNHVVEEEQVPLSTEERKRLIRDVQDDVLGHGPLQLLLDDPTVTEIMVNGPNKIYVEQRGKLTRTEVHFASEDHLRRIIERIVSRVGRRIDESSPLVDARLPDGSRVNAVIPPLAFSGSSLTIRKFSKDPFKVADLINFGTLTPEMAELLHACVEARLNITTFSVALQTVLRSPLETRPRCGRLTDSAILQQAAEVEMTDGGNDRFPFGMRPGVNDNWMQPSFRDAPRQSPPTPMADPRLDLGNARRDCCAYRLQRIELRRLGLLAVQRCGGAAAAAERQHGV